MYSTSLEIHKEINALQPKYALRSPEVKQGSQEDIAIVLKTLKVPVKTSNPKAEWVSNSTTDSISINLTPKYTEDALKRGIVPNLVGMTARDVLYLLENNGMRVKLIGSSTERPYEWSGAVASQSLIAGSTFTKGTQIILQLI